MKFLRQKSLLALITALALLLAFAASPAFGVNGNGDQGLQRAIEAQEAHTDALLARDGVVGTAVGLNAAGHPVVKIFTVSPGVAGLPSQVDGIPVTIEVTGEFFALDPPPHNHGNGDGDGIDPKSRFDRPVPIGVSSGTERLIKVDNTLYCNTGTLGARVSGNSGVFALSNAHVYAQEGSTSMNSSGTVEEAAAVGDVILQPGRADAGGCALNPADQIGTLYDWEPVVLSTSASNTIDAAIALTDADSVGTSTPSDGYGTPSSITASAVVGLEVQKYGRTTSLTTSYVSEINVITLIGYDNGTARFVSQIAIAGGSFSAGGDSGSLVVTQDGNNPVGLLFAGSSTRTLANPIDLVLARFGVTVDGTAGSPPPPPPPGSGTLSVSVSTYKDNYVNKETIQVTATVTDGTDPVAGATVDIIIDTPRFRLACNGLTSDVNGEANCNHKVNSNRDGTGTYTITANASKTDFTSGSGSTMVQVN